jgi:hypothetical protein
VYAAAAIYKEFVISVLTQFSRTIRRSILPGEDDSVERRTPVQVLESMGLAIRKMHAALISAAGLSISPLNHHEFPIGGNHHARIHTSRAGPIL